MKLFPNLAITFFVLSGIVLLVTPQAWWPSYYDLPYMGWAALVCAVAIALVPTHFKTPLAVMFLLNASGDLGLYQLYKHGFEYDKLIHFVTPLIATLALARMWGMKRAALIVVACAITWELFEFLVDQYFKTRIFGVYHLFILRDTIMDIVFNMMGVMIAFAVTQFRRASST